MTDNNGSGQPEQAKLDGVVNELRNVLSGLGDTTPVTEQAPAAAPLNNPISEIERRAPRGDKSNGQAHGNGPGAPAGSGPLASDADFWNGNVLGWPANDAADLPSTPVVGKSSTEPTPGDDGFLREGPVDSGLDSMPTPVESDFDKLAVAWPLLEDVEDVIPAPPLAPAPTPPPVVKAAAPRADPWIQSGFGLDALAPESPPSALPPMPPAAHAPEFVIESSEPTRTEPIASVPAPGLHPAADFEFELPIPGTKEKKEAPVADSGEHLALGVTEMKPRDLIQVACIYPEGQEKAGQAFVSKLREAAEKLRTPMTIQAVFVSSWSPDKVEPQVWAKSATLSGADAMFVLSFRASAALFRNLAETTTKGGTKARLVFLEQTAFPTLYADILVELRRTR